MSEEKKTLMCKQSKVKELCKQWEVSIGAEALSALSDKVADLLEDASARAKANKRRTIKAADL